MTKKNNYFIWVSDCYSNTGEGKLAINFIKRLSILKNYNFHIKSPNLESHSLKVFYKKIINYNFYKSNFSFIYRYTVFLNGIFNLWLNFLLGKKVVYLNYLPLWNFLIFILSPPGTIFGPITGSIYKNNNNNFLNKIFRQYFFPIFFYISIFFLRIRKSKYFFSTSLLKSKLKKENFAFLLDIQLLFYEDKKNKHKKTYDLFIYNRKHSNKINLNFELIFSKKNFKKFKIIVLGEKINLPNIKNLNFIPHDKVKFYLKKSKYTLISSENIYSFFFFDSLTSGAVPLFSKKIEFEKKTIDIKKNNQINFDNNQKFMKEILLIMNGKTKASRPKINKDYVKKLSRKFDFFINNLF